MKKISSVEVSLLDDAELVDYVFIFAAISVGTGNPQKLAAAECLLKAQQLLSPYFKSRRDELLLSVVEASHAGASFWGGPLG